MKKALAIDIGGTKIFNAIINANGEIVSEIKKNSTPKVFIELKVLLENIIKENENEVDVISIATCGAVCNENKKILGSTGNIVEGYSTLDFQSLSKKPVFLENDANSAAWAEHKIGASKDYTHSVMITLGTGVGGGIIIDDRLLKGKSGAAGEMHIRINRENKRPCTCGNYDCLEIYASGTGLKLTAQEVTGDKNATSYDVMEKKNTDEIYKKAFDTWQRDIIEGLISLANIFDPEIIVISGSLAEFVDYEYITAEVNQKIVTSTTVVKKANAGNYAGMIGASLLAMESL